ncbi:MAG: cupredoxin domain-containing protein [Nitrospirota bacterium]
MKRRSRWIIAGALVAVCAMTSATMAEEKQEQQLQVMIKNGALQPETLQAKADIGIVLTVTNGRQADVEFESMELSLEEVIRSGESVTIAIPPLAPGRYEVFDEFQPGVRGWIVVE